MSIDKKFQEQQNAFISPQLSSAPLCRPKAGVNVGDLPDDQRYGYQSREQLQTSLGWFTLLWAIMWLAYGWAMIIWPNAYAYPSEYACADPDELIDCFLATS